MAFHHTSRSSSQLPARLAGALVLSVALGASGFAQSSQLEDDENFIDFYNLKDEDARWEIGVGFSAQDEGDLNKISGDLSISRAFFEFNYEWPVADESSFSMGYREEHSNYDFDGPNAVGLATPFREVKSSALTANFLHADEEGSWIANGSLTFGREQGVSPTEGLYGEATAGKLWKVGEDVELGLGLYMYSKLEDSAVFLPFPILNWQLTKSTRLGLVESSSPGYGLQFDLSERWDAYVVGNYTVRQYRLADRTALTSGAVLDEDLNARAGLIYSGDALRFEVFGGLSRHEISIEANNGLAARDVSDPAPVIGASLSCIF